MPCGDMAQAIVYILARFGCAKAPKRIAPRLVRIIPVWHKRGRVPYKTKKDRTARAAV